MVAEFILILSETFMGVKKSSSIWKTEADLDIS
jgi:hypothetical protein